MVNAGAIAALSLVPGESSAAKWLFIREGLSRFAGRDLALSDEVYASASATNHRNRAIANYLASRGRIHSDPAEAVDLYTRQSCLLTSAEDLAVMSATLADGEINPVTGRRVVPRRLRACARRHGHRRDVPDLGRLAFRCRGAREERDRRRDRGRLARQGRPGTFSPLLYGLGNSVRGQLVARHLSRTLGLSLFASKAQRSTPPATGSPPDTSTG